MSLRDKLDLWLARRAALRYHGRRKETSPHYVVEAPESGRKEPRGKKWREFSKLLCAALSVVMVLVGVWMIREYYRLMEMAITLNSAVVPDAQLPIQGILCIMAPMLSYLLYQMGLKHSRNMYGVDADGQPFRRSIDDMDVPDEPGMENTTYEESFPCGEG